ncbi:MAG: hypothetical protein AAF806_14245 [Bacteroidota bacterium]
MTSKLITLILLLSLAVEGHAQQLKQISVAATTEAIGLPFTNYSPYHPGLEVKGIFKQMDKPKSIRYWNANAGFFYHERLATAIYVGGEYQYTQKFFNEKLGFDIPLGLGYLHTFYPSELYEQTKNGDFETVNQLGRPHLYVNAGFGLSYLGNTRVQPFVRQELLIQTPFANGLPIIPHSMLKIGVHIKLSDNDK